ncbi:hypothetical protein [Flectobacillus major]|jgi:hypothetical protein|uniref:hypothetical protein n=1 Tax=Flectobacillus major TaxID=103 RepID=UPI0006940012|nr:hypothetical protein [Flectobacillus major]
MKNILASLFLMLSLVSCHQQVEQNNLKYFDLKGTFETQIKKLSQRKPSVVKSVKAGNTTDTQTKIIQDWEKELEFFVQTDINKPAFINSYQIEESDSLIRYILKPNEHNTVKSIIIKKKAGVIVAFDALVSDTNYLYSSERRLNAYFDKGSLTDYYIDGYQQLVFGDKKAYTIKGIIK